MPIWTLFGLSRGNASTGWPLREGDDGQSGSRGFPRFHPERCVSGCNDCAAACLPGAIALRPEAEAGPRVAVDYGRCVTCQLCVEVCPQDAFERSSDWAFGVRSRNDLVWQQALNASEASRVRDGIRRCFGRSLHVRHVDAGSCNGCESELRALNNPFYNLHRLGVFFTPSPRFADLLLVTGPVTYAMHDALVATYESMPQPRWVMAVGTCAVSGGVAGGGYACEHGLNGIIPVDVYLPGCPPNPAAMIGALLLLLERRPQQVSGGRAVD
jgi:formate hydrogenlyase subunit 7